MKALRGMDACWDDVPATADGHARAKTASARTSRPSSSRCSRRTGVKGRRLDFFAGCGASMFNNPRESA
jgi:hypothetical protein